MTDTDISIDEARQQLHDIIRKDVPFDDKARDALELARQCLGTDNGHVARIDRETDYWEAIITTDTPDGQTPPDLELDLNDTYCRETIGDEAPNAFHNAPDQGWADDPAFETREFHTYLGVPLIVDNEPYGTVCFVAQEPRSEPFSDAETWFAEHLTRLFERELEREQVEAQLTKQTNFATVLNRVLRHNFRNDISVIRGQTEVLADQLDEEPISETILSKIDNLIEFTEKARELEEVITASSERQQTEIGALIQNVAGSIEQEYPAASISVDCDDDIYLDVLQNFDRAVEELIENAVKHSGDSPIVTVAVEKLPNAVEIEISDNGPGLPENEAQVLETGAETPLTHGSGVGLWKAHWIVTGHDGSLNSLVTENGTTLTMTIPQKSVISIQDQLTDLTRSRDKYKRTFEKAADAIAIVNDDGRIMEANPATGTVFGMKSKELTGRLLSEFLPDEFDFTTVWQEFQEAGSETNTVTVAGGDGEERVIEYSAIADIIPGQHLFISRDITERIERERAIQETKKRLELALQGTDTGVWEWKIGSEDVFWTESIERLFGLDPGTFEGTLAAFKERVHVDDRPKLEDTIETSVENGEPFQLEYRIHRNDGTERWVQGRGDIYEDDETQRMVGVLTDITERKERERTLKTRTEAMEKAPVGVIITDPDKHDNPMVYANEKFREMTGYGEEDIIGHNCRFMQGDETEPEKVDTLRTAIDNGEPTSTVLRNYRKDGTMFWNSVSIAPVTTADGEITNWIGFQEDVTERYERERALKTRTEAMEKAPVGITITDPDNPENPMVYANEKFRELTGCDDDGIIGHFCRCMQGDETDRKKVDEIRTAIDNGEPVSTVLRNYRKDGTVFWNDILIAPVTNADGEITNWIGFQEDVTERYEREQRLERAETVFQNTQDGIFVVDVNEDQEFHIQRVNEVYENLTGLSNEEIQGKTPREVVGDDLGSEIEAQYQECVERRETISYPEEIPVDEELRHWQTKVTPIIKDGDVVTLIGAMRDVTAQKE